MQYANVSLDNQACVLYGCYQTTFVNIVLEQVMLADEWACYHVPHDAGRKTRQAVLVSVVCMQDDSPLRPN